MCLIFHHNVFASTASTLVSATYLCSSFELSSWFFTDKEVQAIATPLLAKIGFTQVMQAFGDKPVAPIQITMLLDLRSMGYLKRAWDCMDDVLVICQKNCAVVENVYSNYYKTRTRIEDCCVILLDNKGPMPTMLC